MTKNSKKSKILRTLFIIGLSLVLIVFVSLGAVYLSVTASAELDIEEIYSPHYATVVLDRDGNEIGSFSNFADNSGLNDYTINAFIAKEDKRFYSHKGVDYIRILGALKNNISAQEVVEGGSTITQQLIKNTHLTDEKTMARKLQEIKLARQLEKELTKDEIIKAYLDVIYFGNGCYGIKSASKYYFDKPTADLTIAESALLAGIISAPSLYNPVANYAISIEKAQMVLRLMQEQNYISESAYSSALAELDSLQIASKREVGSKYLAYALNEANRILDTDKIPKNKNIVVKTYMDYSLQEKMEDMIKSQAYSAQNEDGTMPDIASIVMDNETGGIIAFDGESRFNLEELRRQPASTIKPILVYAPAIEQDLISPASFILDEPISIDGYSPQNATKLYYGWTSIRDNVVRSTNIPAVKVLNQVGVENAKEFASKMGITFDTQDNNLALALGGFNRGISLRELCTAYMTFANNGVYQDSAFVDEIIVNDICVYKRNLKQSRVMRDSTAFLTTSMLQSVAEYGTGRNIKGLGFDVASKTGTNYVDNKNLDAFNVSYTSKHTALCWSGDSFGTGMSTTNNGSTFVTYFVKDIFKFLYEDNPPEDFIVPDSVVEIKLDEDELFNFNLVQADESSNSNRVEYFAKSFLPPKKETVPQLPQKEVYYINRLIKSHGIW